MLSRPRPKNVWLNILLKITVSIKLYFLAAQLLDREKHKRGWIVGFIENHG